MIFPNFASAFEIAVAPSSPILFSLYIHFEHIILCNKCCCCFNNNNNCSRNSSSSNNNNYDYNSSGDFDNFDIIYNRKTVFIIIIVIIMRIKQILN